MTGPDAAVLDLDDAAFAHAGGGGVAGVRLRVAPGESVALIGPNGAGKSTLLQGILGLVPLTAGAMRFGGETAAGASPVGPARADGSADHVPPAASARRAIGYLPQQSSFDPEFPISLRQVVMQGRYRRLGLLRRAGADDRRAVDEALDAVGLASLARRRFGDLSGGQQQRGLLARALAAQPRLLLLDEPFNGLDQPNRDALLDTVRGLKARGVAVIVSTHDLDLAREVCDTVVLLNGTQVAAGPVDEVLTLGNVQECFAGTGVEVDEHTLVVPGHEGLVHDHARPAARQGR